METRALEWLEHDEVDETALPDWARRDTPSLDGGPYRVRVESEGLVLLRGRGSAALRWEEVLVPIRLERPRRLLVAAPRQPPRAPWFELGGRDVDRIEEALRARLEAVEHRGYRERRRARPPVPPDEILRRILERAPLAGAVEIPAATPSVLRSASIGGGIAGLTIGFYGLMVSPMVGLVGGAVGLLSGAGLMGGIEALRKATVGRVLVLTPDGFVGGLDGKNVRAVPWDRVGAFRAGTNLEGRAALEVQDREGNVVARVAARWFGAPLDVIVAVAEAYRSRTGGPAT